MRKRFAGCQLPDLLLLLVQGRRLLHELDVNIQELGRLSKKRRTKSRKSSRKFGRSLVHPRLNRLDLVTPVTSHLHHLHPALHHLLRNLVTPVESPFLILIPIKPIPKRSIVRPLLLPSSLLGDQSLAIVTVEPMIQMTTLSFEATWTITSSTFLQEENLLYSKRNQRNDLDTTLRRTKLSIRMKLSDLEFKGRKRKLLNLKLSRALLEVGSRVLEV